MSKQFSVTCERNQEPILHVLRNALADFKKSVLEINSGTGQHAVLSVLLRPCSEC